MTYDSNNIFAKIINKEIPADIIYEDDDIISFRDINPVAPIHILVIPKAAYINYQDFIKSAPSEIQLKFFSKLSEIATKFSGTDFRLCTNNGSLSGQTIFHFHFHIIGGAQLKGL